MSEVSPQEREAAEQLVERLMQVTGLPDLMHTDDTAAVEAAMMEVIILSFRHIKRQERERCAALTEGFGKAAAATIAMLEQALRGGANE